MLILCAAVCGFILDLLFGDPAWLPHPVVWMGKYVTWAEGQLRARLPQTPESEEQGGVILAVSLPLLTLLITLGVCRLARAIHPAAELAVQTFWCAQALAARGLATESGGVYRALMAQDLPGARRAVARIVGRDTQSLSAEGVTKAAVETVAENFSDGVIAPLFWMLLGGAPLALCYKAVNTMDSMLGYKNARYLHFGRVPAKLDDAANFLPARLAALLLIAAAWLLGEDAASALRIWRRDRRKHASPNSAQCEAAMAGALGLRLGGPASYFGLRHEKPWIGDQRRAIVPDDIRRACRLEYAGALLGLIVLGALWLMICRG